VECKRYFRRAGEIAKDGGEVAVRHLFAAVLEDPGPVVSAVLAGAGISQGVLRGKLLGGREPEQEPISVREEPGELPVAQEPLPSETPLLDRYGRDITRAAREGRLLPFVDSDRTRNTLRQLIKVLMMPTKNNPVLVGEAGVGKTAVVEALAERIALGRDRRFLPGRRLVELSMAEMVAGTKYRGEFEERLTRVIEEVRSHPEVILFIDEFHTVAGAGRAEGAPMDAGNIMKPALARGELRCIGATTITEYRHSVEKDPALERRFQPIQVAEPGRDETLQILEGVRAHRESHFGVTITDETLSATVELAVRFDPTHYLPDKAIDLLDRACAECRVPILSMAANSDRYDPVGVAVVTPEYVARVVAGAGWGGSPNPGCGGWRSISTGTSWDRRRRSPGFAAVSSFPMPGSETAAGRWPSSFSSVPPGWGRPRWLDGSLRTSSPTNAPSSTWTCRSTRRRSAPPASSAPRRGTSAMRMGASSSPGCGPRRIRWSCSTRSKRRPRGCSTCSCSCSTRRRSPTRRDTPRTPATRSSS
jgi:hypothetical protein